MSSDILATSGQISDQPSAIFLEPEHVVLETKEEKQRKESEIEKAASTLVNEFGDESPLQDAFEELEEPSPLQQPETFARPTLIGGAESPPPQEPKMDVDDLADALLLVEDEPLENKQLGVGTLAEGAEMAAGDQVRTTYDFECITIFDPATRVDKQPTLVDIELRNVSKEWIAYKIKSTSNFALTLSQPYFCGLLECNSSVAHQLIARAGVLSSDESHLILETFFLSSLVSRTEKASPPSAQDSFATATTPVVENDPALATDVVDAWEQALPDQLTTTKLRLKVVQKCDENMQEKFIIFCDRFRKEADAERNYLQKWHALGNQVRNENCGWLRWLLFFTVFCCGYFTGAIIFARHQLTDGATGGKRKGIDKSVKAK